MKGVPSTRYLKSLGFVPKVERPKRAYRKRHWGSVVYFIQDQPSGLIKIGIARSATERLYALRIGSPETLTLLGQLGVDNAPALERELHARFWRHHSHGEWFRPDPELLAYVAEASAVGDRRLEADVKKALAAAS